MAKAFLYPRPIRLVSTKPITVLCHFTVATEYTDTMMTLAIVISRHHWDEYNSGSNPTSKSKSADYNTVTVNDLINAHSRINAWYPIDASLRCKLCIRRPPLIYAPRLIDAYPRIASKTKGTLYRVKSRNFFSCLVNNDLRIASCSISSTVGHLRVFPEQSRGIGARH